METPFFSIILPTYQRTYTLVRALNTIQHQSFDDYELIVVDDASRDETGQVVKDWSQKNPRIRYLRSPQRMGQCPCRNLGMENAKGEWLCFLDDDDQYLSTYLDCFHNLIGKNPGAKIFFCGCLVLVHEKREDGWECVESNIRHALDLQQDGKGMSLFLPGDITTGQFVVHRSVPEQCGYWDEPPGEEDYRFILKATRKNRSASMDFPLYVQYQRAWGQPRF